MASGKDRHKTLSDRKYESVIKRLRLSKPRPAKRKFILIQIDALPYATLKRFLHKGSCKFINHLIEREGYHLQGYNCGIPSSTPSVQASIMYGDNLMLPGFRFIDKKSKRQFSFGNPNDAKYVEERFFAGKRGILHDGASYSNQFSGGATHSIFTMSTMTKDKHFRRIKESTLWFFLFLEPFSAFRVLYYSVAELVIEFFSVIGHPFMRLFRRKKGIFRVWIPFRRLLMNSVLAEIITLGSVIDIKRGVPRICINYMNYDDIAHLRGPDSTSAYLMVRALDRRIKRVVKSAREDYDIYIISDHGQVDCVPFRVLNGMKLSEFIERCAKVPSFGLSSEFEGRLSMIGIAMQKSIAFLDYVSAPLRWAGKSFAKGMLRAFKPRHHEFIWKDKEQIFVSDSCALANVYFNFSKDRIELSVIEKRYPGLVAKLVRNKGIGIVMAREKDSIVLFGKGGKMTLTGGSVVKEGRHFLKAYGDESVLVSQLRDFDKKKFIGDLVLFGSYEDGVSTSFTDHVGAHGGIGGDMQSAFFISKKKHDLSKVTDAKELHKIFKEY